MNQRPAGTFKTIDIDLGGGTSKTYELYEVRPFDLMKIWDSVEKETTESEIAEKLLLLCSNITKKELTEVLYPSQVKVLYDAFLEVNAAFLDSGVKKKIWAVIEELFLPQIIRKIKDSFQKLFASLSELGINLHSITDMDSFLSQLNRLQTGDALKKKSTNPQLSKSLQNSDSVNQALPEAHQQKKNIRITVKKETDDWPLKANSGVLIQKGMARYFEHEGVLYNLNGLATEGRDIKPIWLDNKDLGYFFKILDEVIENAPEKNRYVRIKAIKKTPEWPLIVDEVFLVHCYGMRTVEHENTVYNLDGNEIMAIRADNPDLPGTKKDLSIFHKILDEAVQDGSETVS